jgi:hypothetical protein
MKLKRPEIVGKRFGRLVVESVAHEPTSVGRNRWFAHCRCDCGGTTRALPSNLDSGNTLSCGCVQRERASVTLSAMRRTHGQGHTKLYYVWGAMRRRCLVPSTPGYHRYGGRGITVCDAWLGSFEAFRNWAESNGYVEGLTLERKDTNGNYEPGNCIWATYQAQARNTRRNRYITAFGERKLMCEWVKDPRCVAPHTMLIWRLSQGWTPEDAISKPIDRRKGPRRAKA